MRELSEKSDDLRSVSPGTNMVGENDKLTSGLSSAVYMCAVPQKARCGDHNFNSSTWEAAADLCELKSSLVYIMSPGHSGLHGESLASLCSETLSQDSM